MLGGGMIMIERKDALKIEAAIRDVVGQYLKI